MAATSLIVRIMAYTPAPGKHRTKRRARVFRSMEWTKHEMMRHAE
jgi:hypothetical protein